jgi:hypothetical protein
LAMRGALAAICSAAALVATTVPAVAAGNWYPISGTVYENGSWYESSTVRYEGLNNNTIQLNLTSSPCEGINFRLLDTGGHQLGGIAQWNPNATGTKVLATHVASPTYFRNDFQAAFTQYEGCGNYNFAGSEQY